MPDILSKFIFGLAVAGWMSVAAFGGISKNADQSSYDFFYYEESLLDLVNDVRRLSGKNILFRPNDLKGVKISFGREQAELMTAFSEALDVYGFGFKKMADNIYMIQRVRSAEEVAAELQLESTNDSPEDTGSDSSATVEAQGGAETVAAPVVLRPGPVSGPTARTAEAVEMPPSEASSNAAEQAVSRLESPEFVKAVAGFQRRYIEALVAEGFSKEEAMKMAMAFNPVSLVPSEETLPKP